jgi:hypothetical protein
MARISLSIGQDRSYKSLHMRSTWEHLIGEISSLGPFTMPSGRKLSINNLRTNGDFCHQGEAEIAQKR